MKKLCMVSHEVKIPSISDNWMELRGLDLRYCDPDNETFEKSFTTFDDAFEELSRMSFPGCATSKTIFKNRKIRITPFYGLTYNNRTFRKRNFKEFSIRVITRDIDSYITFRALADELPHEEFIQYCQNSLSIKIPPKY